MVRPNISDEMEKEVNALAREITADEYVPVDRLGFEPKLKLILDYLCATRPSLKEASVRHEVDDE
jgi:hypothetical protein